MSDDKDDVSYESQLRRAYQTIPVPAERIRQKIPIPPRRHSKSGRRLAAEVVAALAITGLIVTGIVLIPRFTHRSVPSGSVGTSPSQSSAGPAANAVSCQLPISILGSQTTFGFLQVPSGQFTSVAGSPHGEAFARGLGRWVPVAKNQVAADGSAYAYADFTGGASTLHVVDSHQDRAVVSNAGPVQVLGFLPEGVAYTASSPDGSLSTWLLDNSTGQPHITAQNKVYQWAGGGALWRVGPSTQDAGTALYRLDLRTSTETNWLDVDQYLGREPTASPVLSTEGPIQTPQDHLHHELTIVGFDDGGHPVLVFGSSALGDLSATALARGPQQVDTIFAVGANGAGHAAPDSASGGHSSVWMTDRIGHVYLYQAPKAPTSIGTVQVPNSSISEIAGPCA